MERSLYGSMRVGIVHFKAFPGIETGTGPITESLEKICADDFWTAVEVGWMKDYRVHDTARVPLGQSHLSVAYATQPKVLSNKLNRNHPERAECQKAIDTVKDCVDEARQLGAEIVRLIAGKDPGDTERAEAKKRLVDSLGQILDHAGEEKDGLAFLKLFDRKIGKKNLIGPAPDALDIAPAVRPDFPNFRLLVDLSHFPLLDEHPEQSIPLLVEHLGTIHLGDCAFRDKQNRPTATSSRASASQAARQTRWRSRTSSACSTRTASSTGLSGRSSGPRFARFSKGRSRISEVILANAKRVIRDACALSQRLQ